MSTHNLCFEQKYEKYKNFYLKTLKYKNFYLENFQFLVVEFKYI